MATVSNLNQSLAWGFNPFWASGQLNGTSKSGTGTGTGSYKDGWGASHSYTYTYTIYGLSSISTGGGNSFNLSNWNSWNNTQQGSQANLAYLNGGYGLAVNTGGAIISQNVGDVTYGTPVLTSSQQTASNSQGAALVTTIDNTKGSFPITQTVTFEASESAESNASTTQGYSNTTELSVGAEVSAEFAGIGASVNTSVTNSTTIDSSTTSGTSNSQTITSSLSNTYTVEPGYKIQVAMMYNKQQINMPYTAPVTIEGTIGYSDQWGNSLSNTAGNVINYSNNYGLTPPGAVTNANTGTLLATGVITNLNSLNFTTTQTTLVSPTAAPSARRASSARNGLQLPKGSPAALDKSFLAEVTKDGEAVEVGALYDSGLRNAIFKGSSYGDMIYMKGKGQVAYTQGGSDYVSGSKFNDRIFAGAFNKKTNADIDIIESNDGNDLIRVVSGSHIIDSGNGDDNVYLTLGGVAANRVKLGAGKDKLIIDLTDSEDSGSDFIVTDFSSEDSIKYVGTEGEDLSPTAKVVGNCTEIFINGNHVGTLINQDGTFDDLTGQKLVEVGLLNIGSIMRTEGDDRSSHVQDWRDELIKFTATGGSLITSYDELAKRPVSLTRAVNSLQKYIFQGKQNPSLTSWAISKGNQFDSMQKLASAVIKQARNYGLKNPEIPGTYFDSEKPGFYPYITESIY